MSKWVGENEKNIAAAFEEAAAEDGALFLDEADSFLQSREHASAGWEVKIECDIKNAPRRVRPQH
jgi:SpoVK/Ycf46/Vps4 family AAA+-type ATPase